MIVHVIVLCAVNTSRQTVCQTVQTRAKAGLQPVAGRTMVKIRKHGDECELGRYSRAYTTVDQYAIARQRKRKAARLGRAHLHAKTTASGPRGLVYIRLVPKGCEGGQETC